ncbi:MAG: enoyl-CoA hydratase/isomerase family protein [Candidatus Puniceispirillaceae bacterium]
MTFQTITAEQTGRVLVVTLNRPDNMNAINLELARELCKIAEQTGQNPGIGAVIITGAGNKAFCAGGDLQAFYAFSPEMGAHLKQVTDYFHRAICLFSEMGAPVIAAINGVAAGGGLSMVGFPELAIASKSAKFVSAYTKIGLSPDGSSSFFMPRIIGIRRYYEMVLTNRTLSAEEACDWGLVSEVVDDDQLLSRAMELAQSIADGPQSSYRRIKSLVMSSFDSDLPTQLDKEANFLSDCADSDDGIEGIKAFLSKKPPKFGHS